MLKSQEFRERRRNYGVRIPAADVETHLANGWEIIDEYPDHDVLMRPPAEMIEAAE